MHLTARDLREALEGVPDDTPVLAYDELGVGARIANSACRAVGVPKPRGFGEPFEILHSDAPHRRWTAWPAVAPQTYTGAPWDAEPLVPLKLFLIRLD